MAMVTAAARVSRGTCRHQGSRKSSGGASRKIEPNDLDVSVEHETSGKISKGTFAVSESKPTTSGGGFFFPTLLASTSKGDAVPNVAPTKFNELF